MGWRSGKEEDEEDEEEYIGELGLLLAPYLASASVDVNATINPCGRGDKQTIYALGHE